MTIEIFKTAEAKTSYLATYQAMLDQWPVAHEAIDVVTCLGSTHVNITGPKDAPPLILLSAVTVSSTAWFANIEALSRNHRVYAVDTIGDAGKSSLEREPQHPQEYADWMRDLCRLLRLEKPALAGHSFGGWLTLNIASYAPELVGKIAIIAPSSGIYPFHLFIRVMLRLTRVLPFRPNARQTLQMQAVKGFDLNETFVRMMEVVSATCWTRVIFPHPLTDAELSHITAPTLLLIGDHEVLYDAVKGMERARWLIPNLVGEFVANAGHLLIMEQPETVNRLILTFLDA